jgi:multicomponent Na+:H+ antiporter subunit G
MAHTALDVIAAVVLTLGLLLATVALIGLLRMPHIFDQLHPAGLVTGPAVLLVMLGSVATRSAEIITSAALVALFVLITSPLSTHAVAQAARHRPSGDPPDEAPPREGPG